MTFIDLPATSSHRGGQVWIYADRPLWTMRLGWVTFRSMKLVTRLLTRYWGYLAVVIAVAGFFLRSIGLAIVIALALAGLGYFLFQAPVWCGAETRKNQWCRNNSHGLLLGCHLRQHKLQRVKQTFTLAGGRALARTSKSVSGGLSTIGGAVAGVQVLIAAGVLIFH